MLPPTYLPRRFRKCFRFRTDFRMSRHSRKCVAAVWQMHNLVWRTQDYRRLPHFCKREAAILTSTSEFVIYYTRPPWGTTNGPAEVERVQYRNYMPTCFVRRSVVVVLVDRPLTACRNEASLMHRRCRVAQMVSARAAPIKGNHVTPVQNH